MTLLKEYGALLGVDIEMKFPFEYVLKKKKRSEILSYVEFYLPMEMAPLVGKIRKTEYKISYLKRRIK